jgi:phosphoglycerate dehydrogenase-like enzyme
LTLNFHPSSVRGEDGLRKKRYVATFTSIDSQVIDAMPRGSLFVLVTRMAVVDQEPLWRRTSTGEIRAAIDVYDPEPPPPDSPIRTSPNVLPTPHIAGNTATAHRRCFVTACEDALSALTGKPLRYEVGVRDTLMYAGK